MPFDPFSFLDPKRAEKQIEEDLGQVVFDNFSTLDQLRSERQIEEAIGQSIYTPFSVLDSDLALRQYLFMGGNEVSGFTADNTNITVDDTVHTADET